MTNSRGQLPHRRRSDQGTALQVRLTAAPAIDVRFGIGWGFEVTILDASTGIQDGPGWWSARDAIEWTAAADEQQPALAQPIAPPTAQVSKTGRT